jgi:hypothetical protein
MSTFAKVVLIAFGLAPFVVLASNVRRTLSFDFVLMVTVSTLMGGVFYFLHGLGRHPHVSTVFLILFFLWPPALLVAKVLDPALAWSRLWLSVPLMSWFTMTTGVSTDYPVQGAAGGMFFTLLLGWFPMLPFFLVLHLCYILFHYARDAYHDSV